MPSSGRGQQVSGTSFSGWSSDFHTSSVLRDRERDPILDEDEESESSTPLLMDETVPVEKHIQLRRKLEEARERERDIALSLEHDRSAFGPPSSCCFCSIFGRWPWIAE